MKGAPRSAQFDDIYFSAENGLEETRHVFLEGNNLPAAWQNKPAFTIAETGFGTGLNFLSVWKLFEETAHPEQTLDFISVEKYPLSPEEIKAALAPWADFFGTRIDELLAQYPIRVAGFHRLKINQQITLTLLFDDVNETFAKLDATIDCWFLDGFTPAKNPDMWSEKLFDEMARLSVSGASYATFTAAGDVRRGLAAAGFSVEKKKGFGRKRDMIAGTFLGQGKKTAKALPCGSKVAIIGGGLAGTSCAYVLKQYGYEPVIYERASQLAAEASGNNIGLFNPRFSANRDDMADFFISAYAQLINTARQAKNRIDYDPCGALHVVNNADKEKQYRSLLKKWQWHEDHIMYLNAQEASGKAGIKIQQDCLYLPDSGSLSPRKLCDFYAQDVPVHLNAEIENLKDIDADAIIISNSYEANKFDILSWMPLEKVRGQITEIDSTAELSKLKCNILYGGYIAKTKNNRNIIGATYQKWVENAEAMPDDDDLNIQNMKTALSLSAEENLKVVSARASFRTTPNDRFPVVGVVPERNNIYVSAAFGSHGIIGSILSAHYLADLLREGPKCLSVKTAKSLSPQRFLDRARKKGKLLPESMIQ